VFQLLFFATQIILKGAFCELVLRYYTWWSMAVYTFLTTNYLILSNVSNFCTDIIIKRFSFILTGHQGHCCRHSTELNVYTLNNQQSIYIQQ